MIEGLTPNLARDVRTDRLKSNRIGKLIAATALMLAVIAFVLTFFPYKRPLWPYSFSKTYIAHLEFLDVDLPCQLLGLLAAVNSEEG